MLETKTESKKIFQTLYSDLKSLYTIKVRIILCFIYLFAIILVWRHKPDVIYRSLTIVNYARTNFIHSYHESYITATKDVRHTAVI